ncbi:aspartyl protease family protein [Zhouia sp. PK063]|uniref:aspartyl protease family protein n=1 Tax=Zhouia sp. PK063 TaxID=3373602 RepID=UPI0037B7A0FB
MIKKPYILLFLLCCVCNFSFSQSQYFFTKHKKKQVVPFKLISHLIIFPIEINGVKLSFILDSGISKPVLFNLTDKDSLHLGHLDQIYIKGLGEDDAVKAYRSDHNRFTIKNVENTDQSFYLIQDKSINLSPSIGFPVHGIIGYDIFNDFVVEINYARRKLILHNKKTYKKKVCRKCEVLKMPIENKKPYVFAKTKLQNTDEIDVKLLIDTGSSSALWLFSSENPKISPPKKYFDDYLGKGLSGNIHGKKARTKSFSLGKFTLNEPKVAFPDEVSLKHFTDVGDRNGSVGGEILKRFNLILNYDSEELIIRKNSLFHNPFYYNMSGLSLENSGMHYVKEAFSTSQANYDNNKGVRKLVSSGYEFKLYPSIRISNVRKDSPADKVGLKKGDVILSVNGRLANHYKLYEMVELINKEPGQHIKLLVSRDHTNLKFTFKLEKVL